MPTNMSTGPRTALTDPNKPADFAAALPLAAVAPTVATFADNVITGNAANTLVVNVALGAVCRNAPSTNAVILSVNIARPRDRRWRATSSDTSSAVATSATDWRWR